MTWQAWVIGGLVVAVLLLAVYAAHLHRALRRASTVAADSRQAPSASVGNAPAAVPAQRLPEDVEYVITRVGEQADDDPRPAVRDSVVLSATLGEPMVKAVAFAHGLRRALSPANRNRIGFEVRQEVRRSRKVRRQEMRVAWRRMREEIRAEERAQETV